MKRRFRSGRFWCALAAVVAVSVITFSYRGWLHGEEDSPAATIRNIGLVFFGVLAGILAIWRSVVADRQAKIAHLGLLNERYQKGAEMLGSEVFPVRLGGIYALARLAHEHPEDYHTKIMSLLCAFVRHPVGKAGDEAAEPISGGSLTPGTQFDGGQDEGGNDRARVREDVQEAMRAIHARSVAQIEKEKQEDYILNLARAKLNHAYLTGANLTEAVLTEANLNDAWLDEANLNEANLAEANLAEANLKRANLAGANLARAKLNHAYLTGANLTEAVLTEANLAGAWLDEANLNDAYLAGANLAGAKLKRANLAGAWLVHAQLNHAFLNEANLNDAYLDEAYLAGANLDGVNLTGANLRNCEGLTQERLDHAKADSEHPPKLEGVVDATTGKPLVWRGNPITE